MRIALMTTLALSFGATAQAQQAPPQGQQGYYYYPQPAYFAPYAPYGYQPPAPPAAPAVKAPAPAAALAQPKTDAAAAPAPPPTAKTAERAPASVETLSDPYPAADPQAIETLTGRFRVEQGRLGPVLADADGRTLYLARGDGVEAQCHAAGCAGLWRPYLADGDAAAEGAFGVLQLADGRRQWSYDGRPLYHWIGDQGAGDVTGDGVDGIWFAVRIRRG